MTSPVSIRVIGMDQEAVTAIAAMLDVLDNDTPIELVFEMEVGYQSYTAGIQLHDLIVNRPNTTAIALDSLIGPQLLPFVGCKIRKISTKTEVYLQPPAYLYSYASEQLVKFIEDNFGGDGYCHAYEYERLSVILFETASRMQVLEAQQIVILSNHTTIPESFYGETLPDGYEVEPQEALLWKIATEIVSPE